VPSSPVWRLQVGFAYNLERLISYGTTTSDKDAPQSPLSLIGLEHHHGKLHYELTGEFLERLPGPQIEYLDDPIERLVRTRHPAGPLDASAMADVANGYGYTPAGFGVVGRAWSPRLALAGTYDQSWQANHWPGRLIRLGDRNLNCRNAYR